MGKTVVIGISGGVDSSVAAYLLKQMGYKVIGVFLDLGHPMPPHLPDVMKKLQITWVKRHLSVPFSTAVVEKTLEMYKKGFTPNPCTICNRDSKMLGLYETMKELKADFMATGHYSAVGTKYGKHLLVKDFSNPKDQTYFLSLVKPEIIKHIIFPLNHMKKEEIYKIAESIGILPIIGKKESQDICFSKKMSDFLKHHLGQQPGPIILFPEGKTVGTHKGAHLYTIGERLGAHPTTRERLYVMKKEGNTLYVAPKTYLLSNYISLFDINVFVETLPTDTTLYMQTRYRGPLSEVEYVVKNIVKLKEGLQATPGQIGAIYDKDGYLLMGGIIKGGESVETV